MTLDKLLNTFYADNGIPNDGGVDSKTFQMNVFFLKLNLPNPKFRKELTLIHDIQHVLHSCDTSWEGEGFISGWEVATGLWKRFPINLFVLWAFGYSIWLHPKSVYNGFKKGLNSIGIIDLGMKNAQFMELEFEDLVAITKKDKIVEMGFFQWLQFLVGVLVSQLILLFPLLVAMALLVVFSKE